MLALVGIELEERDVGLELLELVRGREAERAQERRQRVLRALEQRAQQLDVLLLLRHQRA